MEGSLKPLNLKLTKSIAFRCSSSFSPPTILHTGERKMVKRAYDGLLLDAGGTLLQLAKPVEEVYAEIGQKYGLKTTVTEIKQGFKRAFAAPWPEKLRYQGDGKPFWKLVVSEATGCRDENYFEEVYNVSFISWLHGYLAASLSATLLIFHRHLGLAFSSFQVSALVSIMQMVMCGVFQLERRRQLKLAIVSNFDNRLRKLLKDLNVLDLFDVVIISSEVGYEKPDGKIFRAALDQLRVEAGRAVHIGDDEKADRAGANAVGIACWLWGRDVKAFSDLKNRILRADN